MLLPPIIRRIAQASVLLSIVGAIAGCGRDDESISAEARPRTHAYVYNRRISFAMGGEAERFQIEGWSGMEQNFTWTDGPVASLGFRLPRSTTPVMLHVRMSANINPPAIPSQPVEVVIVETFARPPHKKKIAQWNVSEEETFTAVIPPEFVVAPETITRLEFHLPKAISPAEMGRGHDRRRLGVRVFELTFKQMPPTKRGQKNAKPRRPFACEYGERISFGANGEAERLQVKGWSGREPEYTWTDGHTAVIGLRLPRSTKPVTLSVTAAGMNSPPALPFQPVDVVIDGETIAHWEVAHERTYSATIPAKYTTGSDDVVLVSFQMPKAISPSAVGHGADGRLLGLRVRALVVEQGAQPPPEQ